MNKFCDRYLKRRPKWVRAGS